MDRSTTEIILPKSGSKVVLYEYLTTAELRAVKNVALKNIHYDSSSGIVDSSTTAEFMTEGEDVALKSLVKQIFTKEGEEIKENPFDYIANLHHLDGTAVYDKVNELTRGTELTQEAKKK